MSCYQFITVDMKYNNPEAKHNSFHRADLHISVADMWDTWKSSEGEGGGYSPPDIFSSHRVHMLYSFRVGRSGTVQSVGK